MAGSRPSSRPHEDTLPSPYRRAAPALSLTALLLTAAPTAPLGPQTPELRAQETGPVIQRMLALPQRGDEGLRFDLGAGVEGANRTALDFHWDFGDGSAGRSRRGLDVVKHTYVDEGQYTATVRVVDEEGRADQGSIQVTVENVPPHIEVLEPPAFGEATTGKTLDFSALARDPGEDELAYRWDFGDGSVRSGADVEHAYDEPGVYTVRLTVSDGDGGSDEWVFQVPVDRTFVATFDGDYSGTMTNAEGEWPTFLASQEESGRCALSLQTPRTPRGDHVNLGGPLPSPLRPGTYPVTTIKQQPPGSVSGQVRLACDRAGDPCGQGGAPRPWFTAGGQLTLTSVQPHRVAGSFRMEMQRRLDGGSRDFTIEGRFLARPQFGKVPGPTGGPCFPGPEREFAVETASPSHGAKNVDFDEPGIRVRFTSPYDPETLDDSSLRVEYREPDFTMDGIPQERFARVEGMLERIDDRTLRFVPAEPLPDGVWYRVTLTGGERGVRSRDGEPLPEDHSWIFSTAVEPDEMEAATFQVARDAPLVPGKPTLTRVYVRWSPKPEVHPDWQVWRFRSRVWVEVDGERVYGSENGSEKREVELLRPDLHTPVDSVHARNSVNFFGWTPESRGGTSTLRAFVEPVGQEREPPRRFESPPETVRHWDRSPVLTFEYYFGLVESWEDGVPAEARALAERIVRRGEIFAAQNLPVIRVEGRPGGDVPLSEPTLMIPRTQDDGVRIYSDFSGAVDVDTYLVKQLHDQVTVDSDTDLLLVFLPREIQPKLAGYRYDFPGVRTVSLFLNPEDPAYASRGEATVAHEFGHAFDLGHDSRCADDRFLECLCRGKSRSDLIEGFRIHPGGMGGYNKSKREGNEEADLTIAGLAELEECEEVPEGELDRWGLLSLMHGAALRAPNRFIKNDAYEKLIREDRLGAGGAREPPGPRDLAVRTGAGSPLPWPGDGRGGPTGFPTPDGYRAPLVPPADGGEQASRSRYLVTGIVSPGGDRAYLEPLRRLSRSLGSGRTDADGSFRAELVGEDGQVLAAAPFDTVSASGDHPVAPGAGRFFHVSLPAESGARAVVVRGPEGVLGRLVRTSAAPAVWITEPQDGAELAGATVLRWEVSDPDGDPVSVSVSYSPDGTGPWRILSPPTRADSLVLEAGRLPPGPEPTLRVAATDGWHESEAVRRVSTRGELPARPGWPVPGDTVSVPTDVVVEFGTALAEGLPPEGFRLRDEEGSTVPAEVRYDTAGRAAVLSPRSPLRPGRRYEVILDADLRGEHGTRLTLPVRWSFHTAEEAEAGEVPSEKREGPLPLENARPPEEAEAGEVPSEKREGPLPSENARPPQESPAGGAQEAPVEFPGFSVRVREDPGAAFSGRTDEPRTSAYALCEEDRLSSLGLRRTSEESGVTRHVSLHLEEPVDPGEIGTYALKMVSLSVLDPAAPPGRRDSGSGTLRLSRHDAAQPTRRRLAGSATATVGGDEIEIHFDLEVTCADAR